MSSFTNELFSCPLKRGNPNLRNLPDRQQTLYNAVDWSYRLLDPDEQRLFARLSIFTGGFTEEAASTVCNLDGSHPGSMLNRLVTLSNKSLVYASTGLAGEPRFWMLEIIRQYAALQLVQFDELELMQQRHAEYYVQFIWMLSVNPLDIETEMQCVSLEKANLHALIHWAAKTGRQELIDNLGIGLWQAGMGVHLEAAEAAGWQLPLDHISDALV